MLQPGRAIHELTNAPRDVVGTGDPSRVVLRVPVAVG